MIFLLQPPKLKAARHTTNQLKKRHKTVGPCSGVSHTIEPQSDWMTDQLYKEDPKTPAGPNHAENNSKNSEDTVVPAAVGLYEAISDDDDSLFDGLWGDASSTTNNFNQDNSSPNDPSEVYVAETHSNSGTKCSLCQFGVDLGL